jgi:hypothetical protein
MAVARVVLRRRWRISWQDRLWSWPVPSVGVRCRRLTRTVRPQGVKFKKRSPRVNATLQEERGKFLDLAEQRLFEAVDRGAPWAIALVLKTLGRGRGYGDAVDVHLSPRVVYLPAKAPTIHEWEAAHGNGKYSHEAR